MVHLRGLPDARRTKRRLQLPGASFQLLPLSHLCFEHLGGGNQGLLLLGGKPLGERPHKRSETRRARTGVVGQQAAEPFKLGDAGQVDFGAGQHGREKRQQTGLAERPQNVGGVVFGADVFELLRQGPRRNGLLHPGVARVGHLHLGALLHREAEAYAESNQAKQPGGIVVKAVRARRAKLVTLDIRQPIHGVEQQPARSLVQRERDGVAGEVAAPEVLLDGGRGHLGLASGACGFLVPRHDNLRCDTGGEHQFRALADVVLQHRLGAGIFAEGFRHL